MSAQAQMRAMLDQLMGTSRDGDASRQRIRFTDDRVCKSHLLSCCPHDILSGTRMDLGECTKVHDLALRADYEIASKEKDHFFEMDAMDHLQSFITDCDRRTEIAKKRLAETQEEISAEVAAKAERVHELNEEIGKLLAKAEQLGAEGNVEESQQVMKEVEKARAKKRKAEGDTIASPSSSAFWEVYRNSMPASSFQQQKLRVCEVCSAYLGLHDNDRRLADHFGGKLHLGFIEIRDKLEELKKLVAEKQEKRTQERLKRREEREKEERMKRRSTSRSRERKRSRSRERRRHRSRSVSHDRRKRSRSRSRERRRRHKSRSGSRSRSCSHQQSRQNSKDRERERDRSRDRSSKQKSRERDQEKCREQDRKDKKRPYESANGRSDHSQPSSEEREAGEI
ncbi:putative RNA-binding protein Luc7-like 2 isoform X1 [Callorhinchus milii]|uniref:Putative RNA-binding protein Luc7-like 2-like protein n=1 Tax=Callorhinchus milii TaxID=7868 RepID=V9KWN9_CALMI|nr:putative RNA-binding protein Luc7-like 2 isoform X1 [Callorhinchus milii]|eukprot:gi/632986477/ref/XP_007910260.1/ PREDICTED: putative RNA-binding protein Luc7-like 2 isoform X1 [Callorhinchus milii]